MHFYCLKNVSHIENTRTLRLELGDLLSWNIVISVIKYNILWFIWLVGTWIAPILNASRCFSMWVYQIYHFFHSWLLASSVSLSVMSVMFMSLDIPWTRDIASSSVLWSKFAADSEAETFHWSRGNLYREVGWWNIIWGHLNSHYCNFAAI